MASDAPQRTLAKARERVAVGDVERALRDCATVLGSAADPAQRAEANLLIATCRRRMGDRAAALLAAAQAARERPADALVQYALAEIQEFAGDKDAALASAKRAVHLDPAFVPAQFYLGILLGERGEAVAAREAFERVLSIDPRHARAWNNLGNARRALGQLREAETAFSRALDAKLDYPLAAANLAAVQRDKGEVERAEATLRDAIARLGDKPPFRPLLVLLAGLLRERGALDEAATLYLQAIRLSPEESSGEWFNLGLVLSERGDPVQAQEAYARADTGRTRDMRGAIARELALPMVYADAAALDSAREGFSRGLDRLHGQVDRICRDLVPDQVLDGLRWTNFFLAYQGGDDRELQQRYAAFASAMIAKANPRWLDPVPSHAPRRARKRVGFASAFFHVGTVGRYFQSWITTLDRAGFEVFVYHLWPGMDDIAEAIAARADVFRSFGGSEARPSVVAPRIRDDELDVLVFPELGMDVTSFALAALRLAPRQYSAWGHPVTTGHASIDGFISCVSMEPPDAAGHYSERLHLLPDIGTRYEAPVLPAVPAREGFGLPRDRVLLLCPQSLFKIHPDNDALFADVLAANRDAVLVLFSGRHPAITDQFMRRLKIALSQRGLSIQERVRVLPQLGHSDYLGLNLACDAMLDTLHWSGGNTSLDALACGLPLVTLPGRYMRGRQSGAMLSLLGLPELIAQDRDDYIGIASRLCRERALRLELRARITAARGALFGRAEALVALHALLGQD